MRLSKSRKAAVEKSQKCIFPSHVKQLWTGRKKASSVSQETAVESLQKGSFRVTGNSCGKVENK
ncbi:hypothetical protein CHS0354_003976, partial [Potamilus streckersoni]